MATLPVTSTTYETGSCCSFGDGDGTILSSLRRKKETAHLIDDAALAQEMYELTVEERGRILEEIHGVAEEKEETPEFIASCLQKMDASLSYLSQSKRKDYDRAVFLKPNIQSQEKFKVMFLRAENYNARRAAERMARYFTLKRNMFGEDKLVRRITLDDLDENDVDIAKSGRAMLRLPKVDRSGRPVLFVDATKGSTSIAHMRHVNRFCFQLLMDIVEDDEVAQKKGVVLLVYCPGTEFVAGKLPSPSELLAMFKESGVIQHGVPFRYSSIHFCYENPFTKFLITLMQAGMGRDVRLRLRPHFGSATEIRYALRSFGILADGMLVSKGEDDEMSKLWQHHMDSSRHVEQRVNEQLAAEESRTGVVAFPKPTDVLIGRGRPYQEYLGNQIFLKLTDSESEHYKACNHLFEKTQVIMNILKKIRDSGGRFMKRQEDGWEIIDEQLAVEKVRKVFQTRPTPSSTKNISNGSASSRSAKRLKLGPVTSGQK